MRVLSTGELNRALLARNLLLDRADIPVRRALEHLAGLQAQEPQEPFIGLFSRLREFDFSRLREFDPKELDHLLETRQAVRTLLMRRTLHLVTTSDCLAWRPLHQPMLEQRMRAVLSRRLVGVDEAELATTGRPLFHEQARQLTEVGRLVGGRWPQAAPRDLGDALSSLVPLVQVPPRGLWQQAGPARNTTIEAWLGGDPVPAADLDDLVLRYLAAFGPAAVADVRAWSGLAGLRPVLDRLRPQLRTFRDERGRLLFDLPDAPLPDPDVPAPPRFLPAFDNAVLGYDDRSRIIDTERRGLSVTGARFVLLDGRVAATWTLRVAEDSALLTVDPLVEVPDREPVEVEGRRLLCFQAPETSTHRIAWATGR